MLRGTKTSRNLMDLEPENTLDVKVFYFRFHCVRFDIFVRYSRPAYDRFKAHLKEKQGLHSMKY